MLSVQFAESAQFRSYLKGFGEKQEAGYSTAVGFILLCAIPVSSDMRSARKVKLAFIVSIVPR